jgi:hypothetical protein
MAVSGVNGGAIPLGPNAIINGAFDIWQRGASFTSPANGAYTADRWSAVFCSSVSRSTDAPAGFQYSAEFSGTSTTPTLNNRIEAADSSRFANTVVTVSFWAKSIAGTTSLALEVFTPTAIDNFTSITNVQNITLAATPSTNWERYTATFTAPAAATNGLQLRIIRGSGTTTTRIAGVQLEAGPVATPFRRNANSLEGELAACQRYYFQIGNSSDAFKSFTIVTAETSTTVFGFLYPPVRMRANPSTSFPGLFNYQDGTTGRPLSLAVFSQSNDSDIITILGTGTGFTVGRSGRLIAANDTTSVIRLSAEL